MGLTAAELRVGVTADTSRLASGLRSGDQQIHAAGAKSAGVFKQAFALGIGTIGAQLATSVIARGVGFVTGGIDKLRDEGRIVAQTNAVIRSTGGISNVSARQVDSLADSIKNLTGIQDEEVRQGANLLLTFTSIKNAAGAGNDIFNQAVQSTTDLSVAMGQDMKSSAIQLGKALNDPVRGITALRRVGVSFTKEQETQIKNLVKHNKLLDAEKMILGEVNKEFGGSAKAFGESDAGRAAKLSNAVEDAQKAIAKGLLPGVSAFQQSVTKVLTDPKTIASLTSFGKALGATLGAIPWGSIADGLGMIANALKVAVGALNTLPGPLKSGALALLIGSRLPIVGGPIRAGVGGLLGLPGAALGALFGRGKGGALGAAAGAIGSAGATPVHVVNFPPGLGAGGLAGEALGAAGGGGGPIARFMSRIPILGSLMSGGGVLAAILPFVPAIAAASIAAALVAGPLKDTWDRVTKQGQDIQSQAARWGATASSAQLRSAREGVQGQLNSLDPLTRQLDLGGARTSIERVLATIDADIKAADAREGQRAAQAKVRSGSDPIAVTLRNFVAEFRHESRRSATADLHQAQNTVNAVLKHGAGGSFQTLEGLRKGLDRDRGKALKAGDTVAVKGFDKLIAAVNKREERLHTNRQREVDAITSGIRSIFTKAFAGPELSDVTNRSRATQRAHAGIGEKPLKLVSDHSVSVTARNTGATTTAIRATDTRGINRAGFGSVAARVSSNIAATNAVAAAVRTALRVTITPSPVTITLDGRAIGASQVRYEAARTAGRSQSSRAVPQ